MHGALQDIVPGGTHLECNNEGLVHVAGLLAGQCAFWPSHNQRPQEAGVGVALHVHCAAVQPQPGATQSIRRRRRLTKKIETTKLQLSQAKRDGRVMSSAARAGQSRRSPRFFRRGCAMPTSLPTVQLYTRVWPGLAALVLLVKAPDGTMLAGKGSLFRKTTSRTSPGTWKSLGPAAKTSNT